ncbi:MAG: hypothetical protein OXH76_21700, partial [Boseongicola sp.]|nr:hypothetical protein [Boseongicola sp.]
LCVLPWKWLAWDTGFLSRILVPPGFESRNRMLEAGADRVASSVLQLDILGDMRCMNSHLTTSACTVVGEGKAEIDLNSRHIQIETGRAKLLVWRLSRAHIEFSVRRYYACRGTGRCPWARGQW